MSLLPLPCTISSASAQFIAGSAVSYTHLDVYKRQAPDGTPRFDFTDGRIGNPGHDIEGVWFLLEYAKQFGKQMCIRDSPYSIIMGKAGLMNSRVGLIIVYLRCV